MSLIIIRHQIKAIPKSTNSNNCNLWLKTPANLFHTLSIHHFRLFKNETITILNIKKCLLYKPTQDLPIGSKVGFSRSNNINLNTRISLLNKRIILQARRVTAIVTMAPIYRIKSMKVKRTPMNTKTINMSPKVSLSIRPKPTKICLIMSEWGNNRLMKSLKMRKWTFQVEEAARYLKESRMFGHRHRHWMRSQVKVQARTSRMKVWNQIRTSHYKMTKISSVQTSKIKLQFGAWFHTRKRSKMKKCRNTPKAKLVKLRIKPTSPRCHFPLNSARKRMQAKLSLSLSLRPMLMEWKNK